MQNIKDALLRDVDVCREMLKLHDAMASCGYPENPFWDTFSTAADGIYKLIGEHTETFEESITNLALTAPYLTNERRVEMLMAEYKKNFPEQPHPVTSDNDNKASHDGYVSLESRKGCSSVHIACKGDWNENHVTKGRANDKVTPT